MRVRALLFCISLIIFTITQVVIFSSSLLPANFDGHNGSKRIRRSIHSLPPTVYLPDPPLPNIPPTPAPLDDMPDEIRYWLEQLDTTIKSPEQQQEYDDSLIKHQERIEKLQEEWMNNDDPSSKCFRNSRLPCHSLPDITDMIPHDFIGACAPSFLMIGTAKSGSTSLYYYLVSHPQVAQALSGIFNKEVRYFTDHWFKGTDWYIQQFPPITPYDIIFPEDNEPHVHMMIGEASPTYFYDKEAPSRIRAATPLAKLIVLLRNPIDRAYSEKMQITGNKMDFILDPYEDMKYQITHFKQCMDSLTLHKNFTEPVDAFFYCYRSPPLSSSRLHSLPYVLHSLYVFQVRNWLKYFPKEQILFLKSEDMYENPQATMDKVTTHLGLCPWDWNFAKDQIHNRKNNVYSKMSKELRSMLGEFFEEYNYLFYDEIGLDFNWEGN